MQKLHVFKLRARDRIFNSKSMEYPPVLCEISELHVIPYAVRSEFGMDVYPLDYVSG